MQIFNGIFAILLILMNILVPSPKNVENVFSPPPSTGNSMVTVSLIYGNSATIPSLFQVHENLLHHSSTWMNHDHLKFDEKKERAVVFDNYF